MLLLLVVGCLQFVSIMLLVLVLLLLPSETGATLELVMVVNDTAGDDDDEGGAALVGFVATKKKKTIAKRYAAGLAITVTVGAPRFIFGSDMYCRKVSLRVVCLFCIVY